METILLIFAVLTVLINIWVELSKKIYTFKTETGLNAYVAACSVIGSLIAYCGYWTAAGNAFTWYIVIAFAVLGVLAAYAAMYGYDKLIKQILAAVENYKNSINSEEE